MTHTLFELQDEYRGNLVSTGCAFAFRTWVEGKVDTIGIASLVVIIPQVSCGVNESMRYHSVSRVIFSVCR